MVVKLLITMISTTTTSSLLKPIIAIDAMGGDHGLSVTIPAVLKSLQVYQDLHVILVGDETKIHRQLKHQKHVNCVASRITVHHASQVVGMDEPVSSALRNKKDSSMRVAIDLVKEGQASACVSSGNTGALMATAKFVLKTLPGVSRPAIMALLPTMGERDVRVLDLGANVDATSEQLAQFALMGSIAAHCVEGIERPKVGLLNVGEEQIKGNEQVKLAQELIQSIDQINYIGYVEGNDIFKGHVDVVVCDGFVGNIALKTGEGITKMITRYAKEEFKRNWYTKFVAALCYPVFKSLMYRIDPRERNGASLLGLSGIVVKSHGGADAHAFFNAINSAVLGIEKQLPESIGDRVNDILSKGD